MKTDKYLNMKKDIKVTYIEDGEKYTEVATARPALGIFCKQMREWAETQGLDLTKSSSIGRYSEDTEEALAREWTVIRVPDLGNIIAHNGQPVALVEGQKEWTWDSLPVEFEEFEIPQF